MGIITPDPIILTQEPELQELTAENIEANAAEMLRRLEETQRDFPEFQLPPILRELNEELSDLDGKTFEADLESMTVRVTDNETGISKILGEETLMMQKLDPETSEPVGEAEVAFDRVFNPANAITFIENGVPDFEEMEKIANSNTFDQPVIPAGESPEALRQREEEDTRLIRENLQRDAEAQQRENDANSGGQQLNSDSNIFALIAKAIEAIFNGDLSDIGDLFQDFGNALNVSGQDSPDGAKTTVSEPPTPTSNPVAPASNTFENLQQVLDAHPDDHELKTILENPEDYKIEVSSNGVVRVTDADGEVSDYGTSHYKPWKSTGIDEGPIGYAETWNADFNPDDAVTISEVGDGIDNLTPDVLHDIGDSLFRNGGFNLDQEEIEKITLINPVDIPDFTLTNFEDAPDITSDDILAEIKGETVTEENDNTIAPESEDALDTLSSDNSARTGPLGNGSQTSASDYLRQLQEQQGNGALTTTDPNQKIGGGEPGVDLTNGDVTSANGDAAPLRFNTLASAQVGDAGISIVSAFVDPDATSPNTSVAVNNVQAFNV